ncbi:MAG: hypothetical protein J7K68_01380 [Candidatus Diapherotrites archaeon]|nr:hypothetical protein [Candidatus Diapherotrites archaeon]
MGRGLVKYFIILLILLNTAFAEGTEIALDATTHKILNIIDKFELLTEGFSNIVETIGKYVVFVDGADTISNAQSIMYMLYVDGYHEGTDANIYISTHFSGNKEEVRDISSLIDESWQHVRNAKQYKRDAEKYCSASFAMPHLSAAECIEALVGMTLEIEQANKKAVLASERSYSFVKHKADELECLGAGTPYYHSETFNVYSDEIENLNDVDHGRYAKFFQTLMFYGNTEMFTFYKGRKVPRSLGTWYNNLVGSAPGDFSGVGKMLEVADRLDKAIEQMHTHYKIQQERATSQLNDLREKNKGIKDEKIYLIDRSVAEAIAGWQTESYVPIDVRANSYMQEERRLENELDRATYTYSINSMRACQYGQKHYLSNVSFMLDKIIDNSAYTMREQDKLMKEARALREEAENKCNVITNTMNNMKGGQSFMAIKQKVMALCNSARSKQTLGESIRAYAYALRQADIILCLNKSTDTCNLDTIASLDRNIDVLEDTIKRAEKDMDVSRYKQILNKIKRRRERAIAYPLPDSIYEMNEINIITMNTIDEIYNNAKRRYKQTLESKRATFNILINMLSKLVDSGLYPKARCATYSNKASQYEPFFYKDSLDVEAALGTLKEMQTFYTTAIEEISEEVEPEDIIISNVLYTFDEPPACNSPVNTRYNIQIYNPFDFVVEDAVIHIPVIEPISSDRPLLYSNGYIIIKEDMPPGKRLMTFDAETIPLLCNDEYTDILEINENTMLVRKTRQISPKEHFKAHISFNAPGVITATSDKDDAIITITEDTIHLTMYVGKEENVSVTYVSNNTPLSVHIGDTITLMEDDNSVLYALPIGLYCDAYHKNVSITVPFPSLPIDISVERGTWSYVASNKIKIQGLTCGPDEGITITFRMRKRSSLVNDTIAMLEEELQDIQDSPDDVERIEEMIEALADADEDEIIPRAIEIYDEIDAVRDSIEHEDEQAQTIERQREEVNTLIDRAKSLGIDTQQIEKIVQQAEINTARKQYDSAIELFERAKHELRKEISKVLKKRADVLFNDIAPKVDDIKEQYSQLDAYIRDFDIEQFLSHWDAIKQMYVHGDYSTFISEAEQIKANIDTVEQLLHNRKATLDEQFYDACDKETLNKMIEELRQACDSSDDTICDIHHIEQFIESIDEPDYQMIDRCKEIAEEIEDRVNSICESARIWTEKTNSTRAIEAYNSGRCALAIHYAKMEYEHAKEKQPRTGLLTLTNAGLLFGGIAVIGFLFTRMKKPTKRETKMQKVLRRFD